MNMFYEDRLLSALGVIGVATLTGIVGYKAGKAVGYIKGIVDTSKVVNETHRSYQRTRNKVNYQPYYTD